MRTRKESEEDIKIIEHKTGPLTPMERLAVEIWLDIRDAILLQEMAPKK